MTETDISKLNAFKVAKTLLVIMIVLNIAPFVMLSFYIHPFLDDYWFMEVLSKHSLLGATAYWYHSVSGRYASFFIMDLLSLGSGTPAIFRLYPILLMALLTSAFYLLLRQLFSNIYSRTRLMLLSFFLLVLYIYKIPEITTGFYYLTCAWISSIGTIALLVFMSTLYSLFSSSSLSKKLPYTFLGSLLCIFIGGSYETVMAMALVFMFLLVLLLLLKKDSNLLYVAGMGLVLLISSLFNILSPGNIARGGAGIMHFGFRAVFTTGLHCLTSALTLIINTVQNPLLLLSSLLYIPLARKLYSSNVLIKKYLSLHPLLPLLALVLICTAAFFPSLWAGTTPPRVSNQIYLCILIGWFLTLQVLVNYFLSKDYSMDFPSYLSSICKVLLIICLIPSLSNKTTGRAYSDLISKAKSYDEAVSRQETAIQKMKNEGQTDLVIPELFDNPARYPLTIFDNFHTLSADSANFSNKNLARYLQIHSIRVTNNNATDFLSRSRIN